MSGLRFLRVGAANQERPVVADSDDRYFDLRPLAADIDEHFFAADGIAATRRALSAGDLPATDIAGERVGAPVARPPMLYAVGFNFPTHVPELQIEKPDDPILIGKSTHSVVGPTDALLIPPGSTTTDWEVEVGIVIGRRARYLPDREAAASSIAGLVLANDVSERSFQLADAGRQYTKGKSCETFNPLGPWFVPFDDIPDPAAITLATWVNGEQRQSASTADMLFDFVELVLRISKYLVLEPGDVINSGSPDGVAFGGQFPYLTEGDVVETEATGLGRQRLVCRRAEV